MFCVLPAVLLLAASVAGRPAEVYTVRRQDFVFPQHTTPIPYQAYSSQDGVYRVDRQEYGKAYQPFASTTNFRTLPRTDHGQNQYWYPSTVSYDRSEYQPNGVIPPPFSYNTRIPTLFVPAPDQVFRSANPVLTVLRPPTTPQTIFRPTTVSTFEDDPVLPAIPKSVDEGEPLSALADHSKKTSTSRPVKYVPVDDDVEINIEQRDMLMNTYHSPTKPIDETEETVRKSSQGTPRVRRDLYSSYPISFGEQIDTRPSRSQMYFDVYQLYLDEDLAKNARVRDEFEDVPSTSGNFAPQYLAVIENNEITDGVSDEPVSTTETYAAYRPFYDPEDLPPTYKNSIPRYPADVKHYGNSDDVVVVWKPSEEPIVSTIETPTTNADYYEYVDLGAEKTSEASPIACQYSAETETEVVTSATPEIVTVEKPDDEVIVAKSVLSDPKDVMRALFGTSKTSESPADDVDYDYEQVETPNDSVENRPLPTNASCLPCEDQVLELSAGDSVDLSELNALKQLIRTLSSAPEIQTEFSEEDVNVDVQIDDIIFAAIGEEPALYATLGSHPELSDELLKVVESMTRQIDEDIDVTPTTTETVTETTTAADEEKYSTPKTKTELSLSEAFDLALVRGMLSPPFSLSDEETSSDVETSSPVPVTEDVNANDLSSGETLMFDIVRQEPKVSLAFDGNRRK